MKKFLLIMILLFIPFIINSTTYANSNTSYCVLEENTLRILESKDEHKISLIASTTKILTLIVAIESNDYNKNVKVISEDVNMEGSKVYFSINEEVNLIDVMYGLILRSGNDCANILARKIYDDYDLFIRKMNDLCKSIGMTNSTFSNPSGLDNDTINYSTAYDMNLLMIYAMKNNVFRTIASTRSYSFKSSLKSYTFINKHKLVNSGDVIAGKTGYTTKSGRILVSYVNVDNMNISITTINDSNDWSNHKKYISNALNYTKKIIIDKGSFYYNCYEIILNDTLVIPLSCDEDVYLEIIINVDGAYLVIKNYNYVILYKRLDIKRV